MSDNEEKPKELGYWHQQKASSGSGAKRYWLFFGMFAVILALLVSGFFLLVVIYAPSVNILQKTILVIIFAAIILTLIFILNRWSNQESVSQEAQIITLVRREMGRDIVIDQFDSNNPNHLGLVQMAIDDYFENQLAIGMTMIVFMKRQGTEDEVPYDGKITGACEIILTSKFAGETPRPKTTK